VFRVQLVQCVCFSVFSHPQRERGREGDRERERERDQFTNRSTAIATEGGNESSARRHAFYVEVS